jgi:hypothetical protein
MVLIAVCSAKRSPGATVTALAFTLAWRRRMILAECDPAGGDIAAGYLREVPLGGRGLGQLGAALRRRRLAEDLWNQLVDLAPGRDTSLTRLVLPGLAGPAQARTWADRFDAQQPTGWAQLAELFRGLDAGGPGYDVVADCGRLAAAYPPTAVLAAADVTLLVLRPDLPSIRASAVALPALHHTATGPVGLVLVGHGPYSAKDCAAQLLTPVVATLPHDPGAAAVLSNGGEHHRSRLLRAAAHAESQVWQLAGAGSPARGGPARRTVRPGEVRHAG